METIHEVKINGEWRPIDECLWNVVRDTKRKRLAQQRRYYLTNQKPRKKREKRETGRDLLMRFMN